MSRVLLIYEQNMPTVSIMLDLFGRAERSGAFAVDSCKLTDISSAIINENDVLIFIRPNDILSRKIARAAKRAGKTVIVLLDDDLLHVKPGIPWRIGEIKKMLQYADVLMANPYITEKCRQYLNTDRAVTLDTIVEENQISDSGIGDNTIVNVVYAANANHVVMFNEFVLPILDELIQKSDTEFTLTFVGPKPDLTEYEDKLRIEYVEGMLLDEYREFMRSRKFDVGLAPLPETEFTKCKYFNKYLEYSMSGVCGVYSDVIPYSTVIENGENGFLASNTENGWLDTLLKAINDHESRRKCVENAQKDLRDNFSAQKIIDKMVVDIPELRDAPVSSTIHRSFKTDKAEYNLYRIADMAYLVIYYLAKAGVKDVFNRATTHIFRKQAYLK